MSCQRVARSDNGRAIAGNQHKTTKQNEVTIMHKTATPQTSAQKLKAIENYINAYYRKNRQNQNEDMQEALDLCCAIKQIFNSL